MNGAYHLPIISAEGSPFCRTPVRGGRADPRRKLGALHIVPDTIHDIVSEDGVELFFLRDKRAEKCVFLFTFVDLRNAVSLHIS